MAKFLMRSIAKVADGSGMFRVRVNQICERIDTKEAAETLVEYRAQMRAGFPVEIIEVSEEEYATAASGRCGYAAASDLAAVWVPC